MKQHRQEIWLASRHKTQYLDEESEPTSLGGHQGSDVSAGPSPDEDTLDGRELVTLLCRCSVSRFSDPSMEATDDGGRTSTWSPQSACGRWSNRERGRGSHKRQRIDGERGRTHAHASLTWHGCRPRWRCSPRHGASAAAGDAPPRPPSPSTCRSGQPGSTTRPSSLPLRPSSWPRVAAELPRVQQQIRAWRPSNTAAKQRNS